MSRTREKHSNKLYYLFINGIEKSSTSYEIENVLQTVGTSFKGTKTGERIKETIDPLSGKVIIATTVVTIKTESQLEFKVGHKISEIANPTKNDFSVIVACRSKIQNKRGGKVNKEDIKEWTLELS